ncbi:MAG: 4Fe-4S dicluster domain-containing protein [Desulfobacterales bacterium]|nr:4Fe-4S dicluster domain-containing protein [Desulfobacteraceae bacterium]MBT7085233.1 4Fe-4S dicluster domain-containing protein [Desulfobacterales bacterium]
MIKKTFVGLLKPRLEYDILSATHTEPEIIPAPKKVTILSGTSFERSDAVQLKVGDKVKTGQKLVPVIDSEDYVISTVTGTISSISNYTGNFGRAFTSITIDTDDTEEIDEKFGEICNKPDLANAVDFLGSVPGGLPLKILNDPEKSINRIVIYGMDKDLLMTTTQFVVKTRTDLIIKGIGILKEITGIENITMAVPSSLMHNANKTGADVTIIDKEYPSALPFMIAKEVLGDYVPAGRSLEDMGICLISAEAIASLGAAYTEGKIPVKKVVEIVDKDGSKKYVSVTMGTPVSDVFKAFDIKVKDKDRVIVGGPMTGSSIYSVDYPVQADTDAVIIQDGSKVETVSDYPCINCGECVRICPSKIQVNILVRFLEAGEYQEAADAHDLYSCVECGLCSYVCTSKMPVFQYIRLAKYELANAPAEVEAEEETEAAEEENA